MPRRRKIPVAEQENVKPAPKPGKNEKPAKKLKKQPEWLEGDGMTVCNLILSVQKTDCNSAKLITELTKLHKKMGHEAFMAVFLKMIMAFLMRDEADEYAARALKFIGTFVASFGEEVDEEGNSHLIIRHTFLKILEITAKLPHIRTRICQFVTHIMSSFSQRAEIDETIMDGVIERMTVTFVRDVSPVVRQHAIMALQRLQDPEATDDPVTRAYIYHMESDPVAKVRQAAITAIAKKLPIFPHILDRLSDVDEKVRRHTYLQISSFPVKSYRIADRSNIMLAGLHDRSDLVRKAVNNILMPNWIAAYDNDYSEFIKGIKLDSSDAEMLKFRSLAQDALNAVFKKRKMSDLIAVLNLSDGTDNEFRNCLPLDKCGSLEWLIVWKVVIKSHQSYVDGRRKADTNPGGDSNSSDDGDANESTSNVEVIPELSVLCDFIEKFANDFKITAGTEPKYLQISFNHCIITLLEIVQLNDLGDEVGRNKLQALLEKILVEHEVSEYTIKEIVQVLELLIAGVAPRLEFFSKIVTDMVKLGTPCEYSRQTIIEDLINKADMDTKVKANSLKMEMMELKEQESVFVEQKKYADAQNVSERYLSKNEQLIELLRPFTESTDSASQSLVNSLSSIVVPKKITPSGILKNLRICFHAAMMKGVKLITPDMMKIYNDFVRYHLESTDVAIRVWALKTATAYSMLYESLAKEVYVTLKTQLFKSNSVMVWDVTIGGLIDLLLRYTIDKMERHNENITEMSVHNTSGGRGRKGGRTLYTDDGEDPEDLEMVESIDTIQMLMHLLDNNTDTRVHKTIMVGLCKLVLHGQYCTRDLISKFLLAYFNPATEAEINQVLGVFFESLVRMRKQESLHDALIPTLMTLLEAPYDSPLKEVKVDTVLKYVIGATRPVFCSNGLNLHNTLCMKLVELMRDNPENKEILKTVSKEILTLEIGEDTLLRKDMVTHIEALLRNVAIDTRTRKNFSDFCDMMKGVYRPSLKFSSTAMTTKMDVGEDDVAAEEDEEEESGTTAPSKPTYERFSFGDVLDISVSKLKMQEAVVNVTCMPKIAEDEDSAMETSQSESQIGLPASQETEISTISNSDEINIPPTDEEVEDSSDDEHNETVIEAERESNLQETPSERPKRAIANKRHLNVSKELNKSMNSPLRKNPKNVEIPAMSPRTPSRRLAKSVPPVTPKTPAFAASTPKTDRVTRLKTKEDLDPSVRATRSLSRKKTNSEVEKSPARSSRKTPAKAVSTSPKKAAKSAPTSDEKPAKSAAKPTAGKAAKPAEKSAKPAEKAATKKTAIPVIQKATRGAALGQNLTRRQAATAKSAKEKDVKQRPRWQ